MVIPQPEPLEGWALFKSQLPESFDGFIASIAEGSHMAAFCKERGINYTTMLKFVTADPSRSEMYARAREDRADVLGDEIVAIADEDQVILKQPVPGVTIAVFDPTAVARNKLRVESRKWVASKLKPRVYGDKVALEGSINHKVMTDQQLLDRLAAFGIALGSITAKPQEASD